MNNVRRKELNKIINSLEILKGELETLQDEEETARDNLPESLWGSEKYERADEACENLEFAFSALEEAIEYIDIAINGE